MSKLNNELIAVIEDWVKAYEGDDAERVIDLYGGRGGRCAKPRDRQRAARRLRSCCARRS
ncbi:MAG: hypothetical protein IPG25_12430 [Proteobacteria bacterium]|nr:hypothetical protein [Pseudomonadota bacterium]